MNAKRLMVMLLLLALTAAFAQHAHGGNSVAFTVTSEGFDLAEELEAGYTTFTVENQADMPYGISIYRLAEGVSAEDVLAANAAIGEAFMTGGDPNEAIRQADEAADALGTISAGPSGQGSLGLALEPGRYAFIAEVEAEGPMGGGEAFTQEITVSERADAPAAPDVDVVVNLVDFAFAMPAELTSGEQLWEVRNVGQQLHELVLFRLNEGKSVEDMMAFMETEEGEEPGEFVNFVGLLSEGESNFVTFDLEAGDYVALCFIPDYAAEGTGAPHFALGMMHTFTVVDHE